jgi:putative addiction module component (TIGR02574 family)
MMDDECNESPLQLEWTSCGNAASGFNWAYNGFMMQQALELLQRALSLPEEERTALGSSLIESLEEVSDPGAECAWDEEIARRIQDLNSGKAKTASWEEVRQRMSARLTSGKSHQAFH